MRYSLKVLLLLATQALFICGAQAKPFLPTGNYLAYENRDNHGVIVLDAQGDKRISIDNAAQPALSADGNQIAFVRTEYISSPNGRISQSDIWVADISSGNERQLTKTRDSEQNPRWSPDGKSLAFGVNLEGHYGNGYGLVEIMNVADGARRAITSNDGCSNPSWNPNGKTLCFVLKGEVCSVDITGKNRRRLTRNSGTADFPTYSPDGKWIVYSEGADESVTTRIGDRFGPILRSTDSLYRIRASGEDSHHRATKLTDGQADDDMPQFSADGNWIIFSSDRKDRAASPPLDSDDESARYTRTLCLIRADGKDAKIVDVHCDAMFPSWR